MKVLSNLLIKAGLVVEGAADFQDGTTAVTVASSDNSTKVATTAFVKNQAYATDSAVVHIAGTETITGLKTFKGTTSTDGVSLAAESLTSTGWSTTDWTGDFTNGFSHTTGNTTALTNTFAPTVNLWYMISYTVTNRTAGTFTISLAGLTSGALSATGAYGIRATATGTLSITPSATFDGTIVVSVKRILAGLLPATTTYQSSDGTVRMEIRTPNASNSVFIGPDAGKSVVSGYATNSTFVGYAAGLYNVTGINNTFIGSSTGQYNSSGYNNTFIGSSAGLGGNTGYSNTSIGVAAGYNTATGNSNVFVGVNAGYSNVAGVGNTYVGFGSGNATTASGNTYLGYNSGTNNTTGTNNTIIGSSAGSTIGTAGTTSATVITNSIFLGYNARPNANSETNQIAIGYNVVGLGSNTAVLGNSSTVTTAIYGNLILGGTTDAGTGKLQVTGAAAFSSSVTANSFIKSGGTSSQFLKADGSVDSSTYLTGVTSSQITTALGYTPVTSARTITINGTAYDLSADRSWTISSGTNSFQEYTYTATAGQTTFAATYTVGQVQVYYNGSKLEPVEYTATNGTSIVFSPGLNAGDIVDIIAYQTGAGIGRGSLSATSPLAYNSSTGVFSIQQGNGSQAGYISAADWTTFNNKQNALTNPVTGTGSLNALTKWTGSATVGASTITDDGSTVSVLNSAYSSVLRVGSSTNSVYFTPDGGGVGIAATAGGYTGQGIYFASGAGQVEVHTNSVSRIFVANDGKVGVNVTNPNYPLTVGAVANDAISWRNNGTEVGRLGIDGNTSNGWMSLFNSGVTKVQISAGGVNTYFAGSGNFGVGTDAPQGKFHVDNNDPYHMGIQHNKTGTYVTETKFGRPSTTSSLSIIYDIAGAEIAELRRNYSANTFRITNVSTTHMEINASGVTTIPLQPAFSAWTNSNVSGPSVVALGGTIFNDGGYYNTTNYRFTAPVAGRYFFSFYSNIFPNNTNPSQFYFRVNGTRRGAIAYNLNKGTSWYLTSFQQVIKLNAGDYVDVYNDSGDRPDYGSDAWGNFSGYLLG